MSLIPSLNAGAPAQDYFIENIGAQGGVSAATPCIKGSTFGTVRIGDPESGIILRGDPVTGDGSVRGGLTAGSVLNLGGSVASAGAMTISDAGIAATLPLTITGGFGVITQGDVAVGGNVNLTNGQASGKSVSGYWNAQTPAATYNDGTDTAIPNPAGLTAGWYILAMSAPPGSQNEQQVSTIVHYNGALFDIGGSIRSTAGTGDFGFKPTVDRTQIQVHNSTGFNQANIAVSWAKLLN